jgi:uncharacterized protein
MKRLALAVLVLLAPCPTLAAPPAASGAAPDSLALAFPSAGPSGARFWTLRLRPGQDPRAELQRFARARGLRAGFVASCAGSLTRAAIRYANQPAASVREGHFEIVSLTGTLARDGMHLHVACSDSTGATFGGHLMDGSRVYTTAEIVVGEQDRMVFAREPDSTYGYRELVPRRR